jgi:hypothetical protein
MVMAVTRIARDDIAREALETLQLPTGIDLMSEEGLAASVRRTASFTCPTGPGTLVRRTVEVLRGLPEFAEDTSERLASVLDDLVAYGDLLELPVEDDDGRRRSLFLGPPSYVRRAGSNSALVLGIRGEGAPLLSDDLMQQVQYVGHARTLRLPEETSIDEVLSDQALFSVSSEQWLRAPREASSDDVIAFYVSRLDAQGLGGDVELKIIDPSSSPTYYRGRWRQLKSSDDGLFVARRPQAFGADLWCFARVEAGRTVKLTDLPIEDPLAPGADEAWRLQAALDASRGTPQRLRTSPAGDSTRTLLELFSPLPSWTQRRLDIIGTRERGVRGALFAYELPTDENEEEVAFLMSRLWLTPEVTGSP